MNDRTAKFIEEAETRMGGYFARALEKGGGEPLLDVVEACMGVATRHVGRLIDGRLPLTPAVEAEIEASFQRAEKALNDYQAVPADKRS